MNLHSVPELLGAEEAAVAAHAALGDQVRAQPPARVVHLAAVGARVRLPALVHPNTHNHMSVNHFNKYVDV